MSKQNVKVGDSVLIIAGADKGKLATVKGITKDKSRVLIEGKDLKTDIHKAVKARKAQDQSGIITQSGTIAISNVMPVCAACGKATRVSHKEVDGKMVKACAKCGAILETKKVTEKKAKATVRKKAAKAEAVEAPVEAVAAEETAAPKKATVRRKSAKKEDGGNE